METINAELCRPEDNDARIASLKSAIEEGVNSGEAVYFDPVAHLRSVILSRLKTGSIRDTTELFLLQSVTAS